MAAVCKGITSQKQDCRFTISMSVVEIYCEKIRDLLDTSNEGLQVQALAYAALPAAACISAMTCLTLLSDVQASLHVLHDI